MRIQDFTDMDKFHEVKRELRQKQPDWQPLQ